MKLIFNCSPVHSALGQSSDWTVKWAMKAIQEGEETDDFPDVVKAQLRGVILHAQPLPLGPSPHC